MKNTGTEVPEGRNLAVVPASQKPPKVPLEPPESPEDAEDPESQEDAAETGQSSRETRLQGISGDDSPEEDEEAGEDAVDPTETPYMESDSSLGLVDGEQLPRGRGRPRKPPEPGSQGVDSKPRPVTRPHFRVYDSGAIGHSKMSKAAYTYWNGLLEWEKSHIVAYVYRDHPVLLDPAIDPETKKPVDYKYIDKIDGSQPLKSDIDLLNRYGCGSYRIILTELAKSTTQKSTKESGQLCEINIRHIGGNGFGDNPPQDRRINNIANLDVAHPANASYVGYLRSKGIIPEEINKQREEEEMAQVRAAEEQGRTITQLVDKVVDMAQAKSAATGQAISMDDVRREISTSMREMMLELKTTLQPQAAAAPVPQKDPMELALQLVTLMQSSAKSGEGEIAQLRQQLNDAQTQSMAMLMKQVEALSAARTEQVQASASPFSGVTQGLDAIKEMRNTLDELGLGGGKDVADNAADAAVAAGAPKWVAALTPFIPVIQTAVGAFAASMMNRNGMPGQMQPVPQQQMPPQQPGNVVQMSTPPGLPPAPGMQGAGTGAGAATPPQQTQEEATVAAQNALLTGMAQPLYNHLVSTELTGTDFADWFANGYGEEMYNQIVSAGPDTIISVLQNHPATATALAAVTPERVRELVTEFCHPKDGEPEPAS